MFFCCCSYWCYISGVCNNAQLLFSFFRYFNSAEDCLGGKGRFAKFCISEGFTNFMPSETLPHLDIIILHTFFLFPSIVMLDIIKEENTYILTTNRTTHCILCTYNLLCHCSFMYFFALWNLTKNLTVEIALQRRFAHDWVVLLSARRYVHIFIMYSRSTIFCSFSICHVITVIIIIKHDSDLKLQYLHLLIGPKIPRGNITYYCYFSVLWFSNLTIILYTFIRR